MATKVRPINMVDFTGGLNLRGDAFELSPSESPDMLNVDLDARGGFVARKGWTQWGDAAGIGSPWDPRTIFVHELSDGTDRVYVAVAGVLGVTHSEDGTTWSNVTGAVTGCDPHGADFAPWGDSLYIAGGHTSAEQTTRVDNTVFATQLAQAEGSNFSDYTSPTTAFPSCSFVAAHSGYMFAAATEESGVKLPSRLRWSHPNNPEAWHADDYIDILEGGGPITGLVPMRDHLLVFKQSSVWALFGYDSDSWQLVNVSREKGAIHRQAIARSESAVFFYSHPDGIYVISNGESPTEVSSALRPLFTDASFNVAASDDIWLGWVGQRLWFSCPYDTESVASTAKTVFVLDPSVGNGAWVVYRTANNNGVGPFAQGGFGGGSGLKLAAYRTTDLLFKLDDNDLPLDTISGVAQPFESYYVTPWVDGGFPTLKKSWRRPDFVVKERSAEYELQVDVYRDYDEANVVRDKLISVNAGGSGATWGSFTWGDGTLYGPEARGSRIERGGNLGTARSIQLRLSGEISKPWGVDAIVFKFIPRRMR